MRNDSYYGSASRPTRTSKCRLLKRGQRRSARPSRFGRSLGLECLESRTLLTTTVSPIMNMGGNAVDGATSSVVRSADDLSLTLATSGLTAGVYTLSVFVLNNPEFCAGECGADDYVREEVNASLIFGGGTVVDASGEANFELHLSEGDAAGAISGAGVVDSYDAEIQFMIRSKGPAVPELLQEQLTTIDGGCPASGCSDVQMGIHTSPVTQVSVNPMQDRTHDNIPIPGTTARLTRHEDRVTVRIDTNVLPPGAYTVWLGVFNKPRELRRRLRW